MILDENKMSEAEVSLRLALYLIENRLVHNNVEVAIDGAQVRVLEKVYFPIEEFLKCHGCIKVNCESNWRGTYKVGQYILEVHSTPGKGDVVAKLLNGKRLFV
jgi:hypothetical protein